MKLQTALIWLDALLFLLYGILCLNSLSLVQDFTRFGIPGLRLPVGALEVVAGVALLIGLRWRPALLISASGLGLMMLIAFGFRLKFHDSVAASTPSLLLSLLNFYLAVKTTVRPNDSLA